MDTLKTALKYTIGLIILLTIVYVALNYEYFGKQMGFYLFNKKTEQPVVSNNNQNDKPAPAQANWLTIKSLGVHAPIQYIKNANETEFQAALKNGVVQYPGTAKIGTEGNTYIFGHSSDFAFSDGKFKTVFALLPSIQLGAEIFVTDETGKEFTYVVEKEFVVHNSDTYVLDQNTNGAKILTLQTSYPVGTALKRYIVVAKLKE